jgi:hypothetical protein
MGVRLPQQTVPLLNKHQPSLTLESGEKRTSGLLTDTENQLYSGGVTDGSVPFRIGSLDRYLNALKRRFVALVIMPFLSVLTK